MRHASGMAWRRTAGKARNREVEAAPEEMHRARLAEKTGAELFEHTIAVDEDLLEALHGFGIIGRMRRVLRESCRVRQFVWHFVDDDVDSDVVQCRHDCCVEARNRLSGQGELALLPLT